MKEKLNGYIYIYIYIYTRQITLVIIIFYYVLEVVKGNESFVILLFGVITE